MSGPNPGDDGSGPVLRARGPELGLAALLLAIALLVMSDSLRVGIGWADDGPRSGTFPFAVGALLAGASAWIAVSQLMRWRRDDTPFAERSQLLRVGAIALPIALYVAAIFPLGIYVATALLIGGSTRVLGRWSWGRLLPLSLGVPLVCFVVFERWFLVPLPKGPLERLLGF